MQEFFHKKPFILLILLSASATLYFVQYQILGSSHEVVSGFLGNIAFLPLYVIFVTLMIEQIMRERERQTMMRKLNMVIGVFYSEVGNALLGALSGCIPTRDEFRSELRVSGQWQEKDFQQALRFLDGRQIVANSAECDKARLREFLQSKRNFLVGLLENQNLLEHEQFTDLLWSVFHLTEELEARESLDNLPASDLEHLSGDIKRVFGGLAREWVLYMKHLKSDYPFLFSLAVRLNPMVDHPDPVVY